MGLLRLSINKPDLPESLGWKHEATDWILKDDKGNVVKESKADTKHLTSIFFEADLDPEKKYYGYARVITNKTIFEATVSQIEVKDFKKIVQEHPIPSLVAKPFIKLDFDYKNFPSTLFTIKTSPINTTSNAGHLSTDYIIQNSAGRPVFVRTNDKDDLTSKFIDNIILEEGELYFIKVAQRSSSGDISDFATQPIYVKKNPNIELKTPTKDPDIKDGLAISIKPVNEFKNMTVDMYATGIGDAEKIYSETVDGPSLVIPKVNIINSGTNRFIVGISIEYKNGSKEGTKYYPITFSWATNRDEIGN